MVSVMPIGREWSMASVVQSLLFGMKPADPVALGSAVVLLVVAAVVAGYPPAWRASHPGSILWSAPPHE